MYLYRACIMFVLYSVFIAEIHAISNDAILLKNPDTNNHKMIWLLKKPDYPQKLLRWTPFAAYNDNDGIMPGIVLTNEKDNENQKLLFLVAPMFALRQSKLVGTGYIKFRLNELDGIYKGATFKVGIKSFDFNNNQKFDYSLRYIRLDPQIIFHLRASNPEIKKFDISLTTFLISENEATFRQSEFSGLKTIYHFIPRADFDFLKENDDQTSEIKLSMEYQSYNSQNYLKSTAIAIQKYRYSDKKYLYFRWFVSGFLLNTQRKSTSFQNVFTRGSIALIHQGFNDYTYDETFLSRQNQTGFQNNQVSMISGGGFKTPAGSAYSIGMSNHFATSLGFSSDLPFRLPNWIPVRAYFDIGTFSTFGNGMFNKNIIYNGGLSLHYKDFGAIYLPLIFSENIKNIYKGEHNSFFSRVSFSVNLNAIEIGKLPKVIF